MIVALSTTLTVAAEVAYEHVRRSALLHYVAHPLIRFRPETSFPSVWQPGSYETKLYLLGLIPMGRQTIRIELPDGPADGSFRVRDNGQGHLAHTWDHWITIEPLSANRCRYTDRVTIRAGFITPFVWLFALSFYVWRQYRWQRLVRLNFGQITIHKMKCTRSAVGKDYQPVGNKMALTLTEQP